MREYKIFSTTADIGIKVWGKDYSELYKNAVKGFNSMVFGEDFREKIKLCQDLIFHSFVYQGDSCENVLVNLLSEVIFLLYSSQKIVTDINIKKANVKYLYALFETNPLTLEPEIEIKSVTYHNLKVINKKNIKETEIIFDI